MDFLTTSFQDTDIVSSFYGPFKLLDLPLEILLKIFIFLDVPDLQNIGMSCKYLRIIANERFIARSKFFYIQQKIGLSLSLRPSLRDLSQKNIVPVPSVNLHTNFNINQFLLANSLQKSFKQDNLSKQLNRRPSRDELTRVNILPEKQTSQLVKDKVKSFQKAELSDMLESLLKSYKFHHHVKPINIRKDLLNVTFDSPTEVTDDFTRAYEAYLERADSNSRVSSPPSSSRKQSAKELKLKEVLNHIDPSVKVLNMMSTSEVKKDFELSNVRLRKQYFENLQNQNISNTPSRKTSSSSRVPSGSGSYDVPDEVSKDTFEPVIRKPSRTMLKAVIDDNTISYEKLC